MMSSEHASRARAALAFLGTVIGGLTIISQLVLTIFLRIEAGFGFASSVVFFFSFFTILTNILVFLCFASEYASGLPFFRHPATRNAVAVYITVVALVYIFVLQHMWDPQGLTKFLDRLLHYVMPALYLIFWVIAVPKGEARWVQALRWLGYPVAYGVYVMARGALTGVYPYPFLDGGHLGYAVAFRNLGLVFLLFLGVAFLLIALDHWGGRFGRPDRPLDAL